MDEKICFVIQPFNEIYDKRYEDISKPAISGTGLIPYRGDKDPSTKIIIEQIEKKFEDADICFADISTDNPNVWYELGYAFASEKDVVMVCNKQRKEFPFDVRQTIRELTELCGYADPKHFREDYITPALA